MVSSSTSELKSKFRKGIISGTVFLCTLLWCRGWRRASSCRVRNSLSKILEKVYLRYSKSSWRILQEFIGCIPKSWSGKVATVLIGRKDSWGWHAHSRGRSSGKGAVALEGQSHTAAGTAGIDLEHTWLTMSESGRSLQREATVKAGDGRSSFHSVKLDGNGPAASPKYQVKWLDHWADSTYKQRHWRWVCSTITGSMMQKLE